MTDAAGKIFSGDGKSVQVVQNFDRHSFESFILYWGDGRIILR